MDITERDRLDLRQRLTEVIGDRSAAVLMEAIPPVDYSRLATKDDVELLGRELRAEMAERFAGVDGNLVGIDQRFAQVDQRFAQVDQRFAEMHERFAQVDQRFAQVDQRFAEMHERFAEADVRRAHDLRVIVTTQIASMLGFAGLLLSFG